MARSELPDPEPPWSPLERMAAVLGRLGCLGAAGLLIFLLIIAYAAPDWFPAVSAMVP